MTFTHAAAEMEFIYDSQTNRQETLEDRLHLLGIGRSYCNFIIGQEPHQQTFKCSKELLSSYSQVFGDLFYGSMKKKNIDNITMKGVKPKIFKALLWFMDIQKIKLDSFELVCELYCFAKKYGIPILMYECIEYLLNNIKICELKELWKVYEFAKLHMSQSLLLDKCYEIIYTKSREVREYCSWEEKLVEFYDGTIFMPEKVPDKFGRSYMVEPWVRKSCIRQSVDAFYYARELQVLEQTE